MSLREEIFGGPDARKARLLAKKIRSGPTVLALTDMVIPRQETRRTDMRSEDRPYASGAFARMIFRERSHEVELVNLSRGGAMVATAVQPDIFEHIELHLGTDHAVECVVRWAKDGRLGLEFAHETQLRCSEEKKVAVLQEVLNERFSADELKMAKVQPLPAEHRRGERHPLIWSGTLRYRSHAWAVRLRNVSETGVMIECAGAVRNGSDVVLDLGDAGCFDACVSWVHGDHAGLHFRDPFDLNWLSKSKPRVATPDWLRPAYLEADHALDPASEGVWNPMSLGELQTQLEGFLKR
ncbi:hypothetical protein GCM10022276_06230 [Sphingomonas limnosediminicola]|uniref:PilZ domain-containing protein n=1 Tax=Sphingomonas limnosediminicola TaxID=940133 RepID=A0ABP7L117_9SPHN